MTNVFQPLIWHLFAILNPSIQSKNWKSSNMFDIIPPSKKKQTNKSCKKTSSLIVECDCLGKILNCNWSWFVCTFTRWCESGLRFRHRTEYGSRRDDNRKENKFFDERRRRTRVFFSFFFVLYSHSRDSPLYTTRSRWGHFEWSRLSFEGEWKSRWKSTVFLPGGPSSSCFHPAVRRVTSDERGGWINGPSSATKERRG